MSKEVHITVGLPASGKTTWADKFCENRRNIRRLNLDDYKDNIEEGLEEFKYKLEQLAESYNRNSFLIIDGLITTKDRLCLLLDSCENYGFDFIIHLWNEDRALCLHNDKGRRDTNSTISIKNLPLVSEEELEDILLEKYTSLNTRIEKHTVVAKPDWKVFADTFNLPDRLTSDSWSNGGTWGNCWDDTMGTISPSSPEELTDLDEFLEKHYPNISFIQYNKISNLIDTEEWSEGDYYGGCEYHMMKVLPVKDLYDCLQDLGLLEEFSE